MGGTGTTSRTPILCFPMSAVGLTEVLLLYFVPLFPLMFLLSSFHSPPLLFTTTSPLPGSDGSRETVSVVPVVDPAADTRTFGRCR